MRVDTHKQTTEMQTATPHGEELQNDQQVEGVSTSVKTTGVAKTKMMNDRDGDTDAQAQKGKHNNDTTKSHIKTR